MKKKIKAFVKVLGIVFISIMFCACSHTGVSTDKKQQADAARNLGEAYMADGNYTRALRELLKAEHLNPNDPHVHNALGLTYLAKENPEKAVSHLEQALELRPEYSAARNNLGAAYIALEQWDKAAECFEEVADDLLYTTPFYPLTNLGYIYYQTGEYEKAEKYYEEALDLEYDFPKALHGLGQVYMATGDINKAVQYLERAKEKAPKSAQIHADPGRLWRLFFCPLQIPHGLVYIPSGHIHLAQTV
ncbi:MAG: tetratricopeptide repeat protein [Desulfosalsimonas sp.]